MCVECIHCESETVGKVFRADQMSMPDHFQFSIDRGGTFTDVYAEFIKNGIKYQKVLKLLSVDPSNYPDAPREGIRRILESETGEQHPRYQPLDTSKISFIRMGTTVSSTLPLQQGLNSKTPTLPLPADSPTGTATQTTPKQSKLSTF